MLEDTGPDSPSSTRRLRYTASVLTYAVAALYLFHPDLGFAELAVYLWLDPELLVADTRPIAFVLSGTALLVAVMGPWWASRRNRSIRSVSP